jgi:uncharacterized membrane protein YiaA
MNCCSAITYENVNVKILFRLQPAATKELLLSTTEDRTWINENGEARIDGMDKEIDSHSETESDENSEMLRLKGKLIVAEDRAIGSVGFKVYLQYARAGGWFLTVVVLFFFAATQAGRVVNGIDCLHVRVFFQQSPSHTLFIQIGILHFGSIVPILLFEQCLFLLGFLLPFSLVLYVSSKSYDFVFFYLSSDHLL